MAKQFAIISNEMGDWHMAGYRDETVTVVLRQGQTRALCYEAILEELGVEVNLVERDMSGGYYFPKKKDFAPKKKRKKK
jgi:hypothetical protein